MPTLLEMFAFPPSTAFGKSVPKSRIYTHASLTRRVRGLFVSQLAEIVWTHKLSPETLHLPATPAVPEIQVFDLHLKGADIDEAVLLAIDRAIPFPILHRLRSEEGTAYSAAYKRPSEADASQWVVGPRFTSGFRGENDPSPLPAALDLGHLYAAIFERLLPLPARPGEDLSRHLRRCEEHQRLTRRIEQLGAKLHRERQFNKRVELNQQLKLLLAERAALGLGQRQPAAAFPEPACSPGSPCPAGGMREGSSSSTQPLPLDCGSLLPLTRSQPDGPGADAPPEESPEGPSFTSPSPFAAGCESQSGSRLPHSMP